MSKKFKKKKGTVESVAPTRRLSIPIEIGLLSLVLVGSMLLLRSTIDSGHGWGGDFALYIEQAVALNEGSIQELYEENKFTLDNSPAGLGPYLYPMGFPILLAPVVKAVGLDFLAMKYLCSFFFLLGIFLIWCLFKDKFPQALYTLLIAAVVGWNYNFTLFCDNILSDLPFFAFTLLSFFAMERIKSRKGMIGLGVLIFFTYMIRDAGIFLLPAMAAWQYSIWKKGAERPKWITISLPYLVFGLLFIVTKAILPPGAESHINELFGNESSRISENANYYAEMIEKFFLIKNFDAEVGKFMLLHVLFFGTVVMGMICEKSKTLHYLVFTLMTIALYLVWPYNQGMRFLYPIIPFLFFFCFKGILFLTSKVSLKNLGLYIAILLCAVPIYYSIHFSIEQAPKTRDMVERTEIQEAFEYINENIDKTAVIGFHKPRVLRLCTGRRSVFHPFIDYAQVNADYLLLLRGSNEIPLESIYENEAFLIYKNQQ